MSSEPDLLEMLLGCAVPTVNPLRRKEGRKEGISVSGGTIRHLEMAPTTPSLLLIQQTFHTQTPLSLILMYYNFKEEKEAQERPCHSVQLPERRL